MSAGRVLGGILAFIAGIFVLIMCFLFMEAYFGLGGNYAIAWVINLLIGLMALVGGIIGLASKSGGGAAMVAGLLSFILGILSSVVVEFIVLFNQFSLFEVYTSIGPWLGITLECILMIIGAVIMLASGKD